MCECVRRAFSKASFSDNSLLLLTMEKKIRRKSRKPVVVNFWLLFRQCLNSLCTWIDKRLNDGSFRFLPNPGMGLCGWRPLTWGKRGKKLRIASLFTLILLQFLITYGKTPVNFSRPHCSRGFPRAESIHCILRACVASVLDPGRNYFFPCITSSAEWDTLPNRAFLGPESFSLHLGDF